MVNFVKAVGKPDSERSVAKSDVPYPSPRLRIISNAAASITVVTFDANSRIRKLVSFREDVAILGIISHPCPKSPRNLVVVTRAVLIAKHVGVFISKVDRVIIFLQQ